MLSVFRLGVLRVQGPSSLRGSWPLVEDDLLIRLLWFLKDSQADSCKDPQINTDTYNKQYICCQVMKCRASKQHCNVSGLYRARQKFVSGRKCMNIWKRNAITQCNLNQTEARQHQLYASDHDRTQDIVFHSLGTSGTVWSWNIHSPKMKKENDKWI